MYGYQAAEILDVEGLEIYCVTLGLFHKIVPLKYRSSVTSSVSIIP